MEVDKILKSGQLKITPQRQAILRVLSTSDSFINAQMLFTRVLEILPGTNFSTVYRNLDTLVSKGILCRIPRDNGGDLYKIRREEGHHHHVICKGCGATIIIEFCPMEAIREKLEGLGFTPTDHRFEIYGYCDKCREGRQDKNI
ncbi:MAG: transcriptional repressor [Tissierellaceae bacterium]